MMRSRRERGREGGGGGEGRVSLDDTAAADSREREEEERDEGESRFGSCYVWNGMGDWGERPLRSLGLPELEGNNSTKTPMRRF